MTMENFLSFLFLAWRLKLKLIVLSIEIEQNQKTAPRVVQVDPESRVKYIKMGESFNISCTFYVGNPNKNNPLGFTVSIPLNLTKNWMIYK